MNIINVCSCKSVYKKYNNNVPKTEMLTTNWILQRPTASGFAELPVLINTKKRLAMLLTQPRQIAQRQRALASSVFQI